MVAKIRNPLFVVLAGFCISGHSFAAVLSEPGIFMLPLNCTELLPDPTPFINYFEAVGRGVVIKNRRLSQRIFRILAIRAKVYEAVDRQRDQHPIDTLIRKTLCFYREQREPLKSVLYDDEKFIQYLIGAIPEMEGKVDEVVFQWEYDRQQRLAYEQRMQKNQGVISRLKEEAEKQAEAEVLKIAKRAKAQVKIP